MSNTQSKILLIQSTLPVWDVLLSPCTFLLQIQLVTDECSYVPLTFGVTYASANGFTSSLAFYSYVWSFIRTSHRKLHRCLKLSTHYALNSQFLPIAVCQLISYFMFQTRHCERLFHLRSSSTPHHRSTYRSIEHPIPVRSTVLNHAFLMDQST